ncbi:MAG: cation:proton antiporter, partial [Planctomycetota bacterium JB042]
MESAIGVFLIGLVLASTVLVRRRLRRSLVPPIAGYLLIGVLVAAIAEPLGALTDDARAGFELLANVGIVVLLFRVGVESDPSGLRAQLGRALPIWAGNVALSAVLAYAATRYVLDLALVPSLFAAVACSATSVGVAIGVWRERGAARSDDGLLLLDVAELDDLSSVALVAMLIALVPALLGDGDSAPALLRALGTFAVSALVFGAACIVFSKTVEPVFARTFRRRGSRADAVLLIAAGALL